MVHQPVSPSVQKAMVDNVVRMHLQLKRLCVSCVWVLQRGHSDDGFDLALTVCMYYLRKDDLFVLSLFVLSLFVIAACG